MRKGWAFFGGRRGRGDETRERERKRGDYVIDPLLEARYCRQRRWVPKIVAAGKDEMSQRDGLEQKNRPVTE
jgi:hypothetical protein